MRAPPRAAAVLACLAESPVWLLMARRGLRPAGSRPRWKHPFQSIWRLLPPLFLHSALVLQRRG